MRKGLALSALIVLSRASAGAETRRFADDVLQYGLVRASAGASHQVR
jgi:hypothetical protein